jgi:spore maturation protein SpmA
MYWLFLEVLAGVNLAISGFITTVYLRMYKKARSAFTVSLLLFSVLLVVQSSVALVVFHGMSLRFSADVAEPLLALMVTITLASVALLKVVST